MEHSRIIYHGVQEADKDTVTSQHLQEIASIEERVTREWQPYRVMTVQPLMSDGLRQLHQQAIGELE
jgi:hypothetical protein